MSKRNIKKIAEAQTTNPRYELTANDLTELIPEVVECQYSDTAFDLITKIFKYGYAMGERATKAASK